MGMKGGSAGWVRWSRRGVCKPLRAWRSGWLPPPQGKSQLVMASSQSINFWGPLLQLPCPKAAWDLLRIEESELTLCQRSSWNGIPESLPKEIYQRVPCDWGQELVMAKGQVTFHLPRTKYVIGM